MRLPALSCFLVVGFAPLSFFAGGSVLLFCSVSRARGLRLFPPRLRLAGYEPSERPSGLLVRLFPSRLGFRGYDGDAVNLDFDRPASLRFHYVVRALRHRPARGAVADAKAAYTSIIGITWNPFHRAS